MRALIFYVQLSAFQASLAIHMYIYIYIYIYIYKYKNEYKYILVCMYRRMWVYMRVCVCAHCYDTYMYVVNALYLQAPAIVNFEYKKAFSQRS